MTYAIKVENLGKRYLIGHQKKESYSTLRDTLAHGAKSLVNRVLHPNLASSGSEIEEFWALKDVSFEIKPGDRVGIIGRNGAGKSTLLKILSRITEPSTGRFTTRGRVASLLEVGTGFHPELTGRENIFLNGAILGMTRADVKRQFDAIVDFSGVEKFLDTPVKRYSSGMYVRLAFAVAAHLEPDILIVDEVLAVGDAEFQKKCLGKMEEVGKEGRTVVFVSHNMGAVRRLCDRGILIEGGYIAAQNSAENILHEYSLISRDLKFRRTGKGLAKTVEANFLTKIGLEESSIIEMGDDLKICLSIESTEPVEKLELAANIRNRDDQIVTHVTSLDTNQLFDIQDANTHKFDILIKDLRLTPGIYAVDLYVGQPTGQSDFIQNALSFEIIQGKKILRPGCFPSHVILYSHSQWQQKS